MYLSQSDEDTLHIAEKLLTPQASSIILLFGQLGAGKTTFVKGIARALGIRDTVTSPSFQIIREYNTEELVLVHMDFYRLKSCEDVALLDISRFLSLKKYCLCVEWPERCPELFALHSVIEVHFEVNTKDQSRKIHIVSP